jgi:hypothetical protein
VKSKLFCRDNKNYLIRGKIRPALLN